MKKKNIIISESQLEDLLKNIMGAITGEKSTNSFSLSDGGNWLSKMFQSFFPNKTVNQTSLSNSVFSNMVNKIIDTFEGGYYDDDWHLQGMGDSGETMYGIDRKHGPESKTGVGLEFWKLIDDDKSKNPECYKLEYDPAKGKGKCYNPTLSNQLKQKIEQMMRPQYDDLSKRFLTPEAKQIVDSDNNLLFNFTYAVWNGSGYFQDFAKYINGLVKSGEKNPKVLSQKLIDYRKNYSSRSSFANNLVRRSGREMEKLLSIA